MDLNRTLGFTRDGTAWVNPVGMGMRHFTERIVRAPSPELEQMRRYFGTNLTPEIIEGVLRMASYGHLRDLTDLEYETVEIDPHLACETGKRMRALAAAKINVVQATGEGVDDKRAAYWTDVVRQQIAWIPGFRKSIQQLNYGHGHGRAALEKMWVENPAGSDVKWRIDSLNWIHPRRLCLGPERELRVRDDPWAGSGFEARGLALRDVPFKFLGFTPQLFNDYPEREGFLPRALFWSFFKRFSKREQLVLIEVFGKPWRVMEASDPEQANYDDMKEAAKFIDEMGGEATGVAPPGTTVKTDQPQKGAGEIHRDVIDDSNGHISKLILGQERTTEATPGALGSNGDEIAQSEQDRIFGEDAWDIGDLLTEGLAGDIVVMNGGPEELLNCPTIELKFEQPTNRSQEIDNTTNAVKVGVPLAVDEIYERLGFRKPRAGEAVVKFQPGSMPSPGGIQSGVMAGEPEEDDDEPGGGASPLGEGGEALPSQQMSNRPLMHARAAVVLELLRQASEE